MPFKSYEQMAYLKHNEPEVYERWVKKYGTKISGGGGHSPVKIMKRENSIGDTNGEGN